MPLMRRRRAPARRKRVYRKRQQTGRPRRAPRYQSQLFTETQKCNYNINPAPTCPGVGPDGVIAVQASTQLTPGKFMVRITDIPQQQNQQALQQNYKILKATFILIPKFSNADPNTAQQNSSVSVNTWENARITQAINDTNNGLGTVTSELEVLQNNGSRIKPLTSKPIYISFKPKPILDKMDPTSGATPVTSKQRDWIAFGDTDGEPQNPYHQGVDWVVSCDNTATTGFLDIADVQCKVTFVCKDPR